MGIMLIAIIGVVALGPQYEVLVDTIAVTTNTLENIEIQKQYKEVGEKILPLLKEKYGDGNFEIVRAMDGAESYLIDFEIKTSYMNSTFIISANTVGRILEDNFIDIYANEKWNIIDVEKYAIEKAIEENNKLFLQYDMSFGRDYQRFLGFDDYKEGRVPTIEDLISRVDLGSGRRLQIGISYTKNDLEKFTENLIKVYKIYALQSGSDYYFDDTLFFEFENGVNPFCDPNKDKLGAYVAGGYIRDAGSLYLLYLNPTPFEIDK